MHKIYLILIFIGYIFPVTMMIDASDWDPDSWTYLNLYLGSIVDPDNGQNNLGWDLAFQRYHIRTNSGLAGIGNGGAYVDSINVWDDTSYALLTEVPDNSFFESDTIVDGFYDINTHEYYPGIANPALETWSNIGANFQMEYTNNQFIVRSASGNEFYKFWVTNYYNSNGTSGFITIVFDLINSIDFILGDVNQDNIIDILDVVLTVNIIMGFEYNQAADVNQDGLSNVLDLVMMVDWIMNGHPDDDSIDINCEDYTFLECLENFDCLWDYGDSECDSYELDCEDYNYEECFYYPECGWDDDDDECDDYYINCGEFIYPDCLLEPECYWNDEDKECQEY